MNDNYVYDRLIERLNSKGSSLPLIKCDELYAMLAEIYTAEEAEFIANLPLTPFTASGLRETMRESDKAGLLDRLERMADTGQLHTVDSPAGETYYLINTLIPGYLELCFMSGAVDSHREKVAGLFYDYIKKLEAEPNLEIEGVWRFPFFRTLPVEKEIESNTSIQPYDKVSRYVHKADYIAVGTCFCNQVQTLSLAPDDLPKEVCMTFGPTAQSYIKRGFARKISKEEAFSILNEAEKAGLIHCASNTGKYIDGMCNCHVRHCKFLQNIKKSVKPYMVSPSGFVVEYNSADCTSCGACEDRCQMDALVMNGDELVFNSDRCIGCGLCISYCPTGCLQLKAREQAHVPPVNNIQLYATMISSMKK